jgi:hypothetical protein
MLEKTIVNAKRYLPHSLGVLYALGALYVIAAHFNARDEKKVEEDFAPARVNEFLDWDSDEQAYKGLRYNPQRNAWESPNIFPQGMNLDSPAITNTSPALRSLEEKPKQNLLEPQKPKIKTQSPEL